jgi:hypothetical protein
MAEENKFNIMIVAIVAIVAVVAIVLIVVGKAGENTVVSGQTPAFPVDDQSNLKGNMALKTCDSGQPGTQVICDCEYQSASGLPNTNYGSVCTATAWGGLYHLTGASNCKTAC